jgi:hypothetical protein
MCSRSFEVISVRLDMPAKARLLLAQRQGLLAGGSLISGRAAYRAAREATYNAGSSARSAIPFFTSSTNFASAAFSSAVSVNPAPVRTPVPAPPT